MFQHLAVLSCCLLLFNGCQSGPFARSSQSSDDLAENVSEKKKESDIQKKLRVAMAEERKKGRQDRHRRNSQGDDSEQLAEITIPDQKTSPSPQVAESRALPISTPQTATTQVDEATLQQELSLAYDADRAGNLEKAQGYYQRVLAMDGSHFEALHRLAIIEDKNKNFPAAEAYYLKALKLDPANANLLSDIGYSYMLQGRDDYGEKYLREALKYQPRHGRSLDHLGWYYGRSGQYDQALALFRMTGGEAQARQKFAQLFPGVNPDQNLAQSGISQHNVQRVAPANLSSGIQPVEQVQIEPQQPVQYATGQNGFVQNQSQPQAPAMNQADLNPTLQIAEMMRRERDKAVQARDASQELPAISPQPSLMRQTTSVPQNTLPYQENRQHLVHAPQPVAPPVQYADPDAQIQAWPPAGDPEISQAVDASNYWAMKEQQQNQPVQQAPQNQNQQYQNQQNQAGPGFPQAQQGQYQNMPQAGQPMYGNQYQVPGQFPDYRINSTQQNLNRENQNSGNLQQNADQAQMREAARTGMNAGPGQMFPVAEQQQQQADGNAALRSSQMQVGNLMPASAQVPQQNVFQPGGQNIRQVQFDQPAYQRQQQQQPASGVRQAGYEYSNQSVPQNGYQGQGMQPVQNAGGFPQFPSELPQSAMYSTNPAFAPANMRTTAGDLQQGMQQGAYQSSQQAADQNRQSLMNPNQPAPSRFQWGAQPAPLPGQYPTSQGQY
ncbi:tetratricopeptide repeat protein [Gimesia algae]|nr:tetratricopeptide repeat protein [Gimesia algae]